MADSVSVSGPITVKSDTNARVAYDLMILISNSEEVEKSERKHRDYWLKLFWQCYQAASGQTLSHTLQKKQT